MREIQEQIAYFQQYAEEKFQNRIDQLDHDREHTKIPLEHGRVAYKREQQTFEDDLSRKIEQLAIEDFHYIKYSLACIKHRYTRKLSMRYGLR